MSKILIGLLIITTLLTVTVSSPISRTVTAITRDDIDYRLPNNSIPISYKVALIPHLTVGNFKFDGEISIDLQVVEATSSLTLHTNDLTIDENATSLTGKNTVQTISNHTYDLTRHFLMINTATVLAPGNYTLNIKYIGNLNNAMRGFYRSSYINDNGETVWLGTTQFEPTHARQAFPCYDEPALKATFDISIKHSVNYTAISNMPVLRQSEVNATEDTIWTYFETTPIMSTYLVAFIVSDYGYISNVNQTYRVWVRKNALAYAQYAYDIGLVELDLMENYTGVAYNLPKMDQAGIPDFSAGAMENWGLVTYRESYFLNQENVTRVNIHQYTATVISHEFAHQWFGNLVGPAWWKYLWLNEGFARYYQYYITDMAEDNWRTVDQFVIKVQQGAAFVDDGMATSHPLNYDVGSPSEISAIFDTISYSKGACVIRMMQHFMSEEVFKAGLTKYLNARAYSYADSDDLFEGLQAAVNESYILPVHLSIKEIMDTWVEQMGYPVITVVRNYTTGTAVLTQERFLLTESTVSDNHDYKWWVPINYVLESNPDFRDTLADDWIRAQDESIIVNIDNSMDLWLIINKQQTGYYRVNYDDTNWALITKYLNSNKYKNIHVHNRAQLIDDSLNLARSGRLSYSVTFDLLTHLVQEVDYVPWYAAFTGFSFLKRMLANTKEYDTFKAFVLHLVTALVEDVGYDALKDDEHLTKFNRPNALTWACNYGHVACLSTAQEKLLAYLDAPDTYFIDPNLKTFVLCAGIRASDTSTWNNLYARYQQTTVSAEKTEILTALGCSNNKNILKNYLQLTLNDSALESSVSPSVFYAVYSGSEVGIDVALDFIIDNALAIFVADGHNKNIGTYLTGIGYRITTKEQYEKLSTFLEQQVSIVADTGATGIAYAKSNLQWIEKHEPTIRGWLKEWTDISTEPGTEPSTEPSTESGNSATVFTTSLSLSMVTLLLHCIQ
ncbi:aminopeptidase N [Cephus cinctus]|uniref:Aminopeptidase n=1 Tax=Cephus cinctus TaxID=211228 RepID=A0AAJ7FSG8_CEPCN|nr:aminopeptidase N [Cephus cinctus]XP_015606017.1 aminopeptidase N [Cephus cinctus]